MIMRNKIKLTKHVDVSRDRLLLRKKCKGVRESRPSTIVIQIDGVATPRNGMPKFSYFKASRM